MLTVKELVELTYEVQPRPIPHWIIELGSDTDEYYYTIVQDEETVRWLVSNAPPEAIVVQRQGQVCYATRAYQEFGAEMVLSVHDPDHPMVLDLGNRHHWVDWASAHELWKEHI